VTELALFASTFVTVFALGFQSLNVNQGRYLAAFITSFVISSASIALYKLLPDATWTQCAAYMVGAATGIVSSMWAHRRWKAWWEGVLERWNTPVPRAARNAPPRPTRIPPPPAIRPPGTVAGRPVGFVDHTDKH
jgi:hypothetical protein